jgi:hypothetical protein
MSEMHLSIHEDAWDILSEASTMQDFFRLMPRTVPKALHFALRRGIYLPHTADELHTTRPESFGLWNEAWEDEECLLVLPNEFPKAFQMSDEGSVMRVQFDLEQVFRGLIRSLRVVGGREVERAKSDGALRSGGVFLSTGIAIPRSWLLFPFLERTRGGYPRRGDDQVSPRVGESGWRKA